MIMYNASEFSFVCGGLGVGMGAFVNAGKRGRVCVNEQGNEDTPLNKDILIFLLCPRDRK